jgi:hypothetical protein
MRRYVTVLLICITAGVVAVLAGGVKAARASTACKANYNYDMGYNAPSAINVGSSEGAAVSISSGSTRFSGSIRVFLEVIDPYAPSNNLIVGIRETGSGPQLYVENNGTFVSGSISNVSEGPGYQVYLDRLGTNTWEAWWYDFPYNYHYTATVDGANTSFFAHTETTNSTCNSFVAGFSNITPWSVGSMGQVNNSGGIYIVNNHVSSSAFTVYGPNF